MMGQVKMGQSIVALVDGYTDVTLKRVRAAPVS